MIPFDLNLITNFRALVFDLDGTLVDSMPAHNRAWQQVLSDCGALVTEQELYQLAGTPNMATAKIFIERFQLTATPEDIVTEKESLFEKSLGSLRVIPSVAAIAEQFYSEKPLAIVSGSTRSRITETLAATGLSHLFQRIVSCEDTPEGKPHPAPFLLGAKLLKAPPHECLVFEDGEAGIIGAIAAQMSVVYVKQGQLFERSITQARV
jgi:HAD superfamily hydrolase (TIGR01509 family)